jgi:hypothetical protein
MTYKIHVSVYHFHLHDMYFDTYTYTPSMCIYIFTLILTYMSCKIQKYAIT